MILKKPLGGMLMADKNRNLGLSPRCLLVLIVLCTGSGTTAFSQSFSCPQVVLSENHTCAVGNCQGQYSVNLCNTSDLTSSYQCVYQTPTCCGQPQVAFSSAVEGGACTTNGCSVIKEKSPSSAASLAADKIDKIDGKSAAARSRQAPRPAKVVVAKESKS
jgi:hypothetical protein